MKVTTLHELYVEELRDLYSAETQLVKALPGMAKAASADELRQAFEEHLDQTRGHVERLEGIFEELGEKPTGKKCKGMEGLIEEGKETAKLKGDSAVRDAGLIAAAQKVEHYEIAGYGTARTFARMLDQTQAADILQETLDEEGETDHRLTELAESVVNVEAAMSNADSDSE